MRKLIAAILLCSLLAGCQDNQKSSTGYTNPEDFDDSQMSTVMIDQGVYIESIDGQKYNEDDSFWKANHSVQNNLVILSGRHTLGVSFERGYHHLYSLRTLEINVTIEAGKVYRITKSKNANGQPIIGVYHRKQLIAQTSLK